MPSDVFPPRQGEERRAELVRIAIDVFGESGYAGGRIDEIARRAGIRRPSVLYHFPDKAALYAASIARVVGDIRDRVVATEKSAGERLEAIADVWIDFVIDRPNAARLLLRQLIDAEQVPTTDSSAAVLELLGSIQHALDERTGTSPPKTIDASEFSLILSSTSLVWVAGRGAVEGALGLDTLAPQSIQRHRRTLHALVRQLLAASAEATHPRTDSPSPLREREVEKHADPPPLPAKLPRHSMRSR